MHTIKNNSKAGQGVWTVDGLVFLRRGQTRTLELTEKGLERAQRLPFLEVSEAKAGSGEAIQEPAVTGAQPEPIKSDFDPELADAMTDDELRAYIKERDGKAPHPRTGHDKLVALAKGEAA